MNSDPELHSPKFNVTGQDNFDMDAALDVLLNLLIAHHEIVHGHSPQECEPAPDESEERRAKARAK